METPFDVKLIDYCNTDAQREKLQKWEQLGSQRLAAEAMGCDPVQLRKALRAAKKNAARQGYAPGHFSDGTAPGYRMGKVTVHRRNGEVVDTWERQHPETENALERLREAIDAICQDATGLAPISAKPQHVSDDVITVYPMGDPHCGMLAWEAETGENFDLDEFERRQKGAIDRLVSAAPASREALFINLGDMFHADDGTNRTPASGHALDVDGRYTKVALVAFKCMVYAINRLRENHETVTVWNRPGNHDPHAWLTLAMALNAYFANDDRVSVPVDPSMFSYMRFGKNMFASTHGHGPKLHELPMIMAHDRKEDWALTDYRVWFVGHFHHRKVQQDLTGCTVEIARTLAGSDAWHHGKGYRSQKDMQAIVFHREYGELERHTCSLAMIA